MFLSYSCDSIFIEADDPRALADWYREKFGFKEYSVKAGEFDSDEIPPGSVVVGANKNEAGMVIAPRSADQAPPATVRVIFASNVTDAYKKLAANGVNADPIQDDS